MTTIDSREFRRTMGLFATGVTVVTAEADGEIHGMTANSVTSVSLDPPLVLVCVDRRAHMCGIIAKAGRFAINILSVHQEAVSQHFAGSPGDVALPFSSLDGVPSLPGTLATIVCTTHEVLAGGDHIIVLGRVDVTQQAPEMPPPLLYFAGRYERLEKEHTAALNGHGAAKRRAD
ncbi:MAG TPA: flavin reductase family protein [Roseiflexaceae bacterium]|jgi:flavin reductase (DIM6/NTAB) family NADH-FMN oxidoreductase RutF|nr:flavin reductase family protein [Roseiflexaceae bacterium]